MKVAIFLCYGVFEPTNQEYCDYIDSMAKYLSENSIEKLIICGGHTNPKEPLSEAETVFDYLKLKHSLKLPIILETESLTTSQNLEFSARQLDRVHDDIVIFCDLYRLAKVIWLSAHFLLGKSRDEISNSLLDYSFTRKIKPFTDWNMTIIPFDFPSRDKYQAFGQSFSSLLEVEALYDHSLEERFISQRKKDFGIADSKVDKAIKEALQAYKTGKLKPWPVKE